jgi:hypothetical protein
MTLRNKTIVITERTPTRNRLTAFMRISMNFVKVFIETPKFAVLKKGGALGPAHNFR